MQRGRAAKMWRKDGCSALFVLDVFLLDCCQICDGFFIQSTCDTIVFKPIKVTYNTLSYIKSQRC